MTVAVVWLRCTLMQRCLADELHVDIMPILLCNGLRFFEHLVMMPVHLERLDVVSLPSGRTHLKFRVLK